MSKPRWEQKLDSYGKALGRLAAIVNESKRRELNRFAVKQLFSGCKNTIIIRNSKDFLATFYG